MHRLRTAAGVLALWLASATPSSAATAEVALEGQKYGFSAILYVTAAAGERNEITVMREGDRLRVTDATPVTGRGWCRSRLDGSAVCDRPEWAPFARLHIDAGDLDDTVGAGTGPRAHMAGGAGNDVLAVLTQGPDAANAIFEGGPGDDRMVGSSGRDEFREGAAANGSDIMETDASDRVIYADRIEPVRVELNAEADDGEAGERDLVGREAGTVLSGMGADTLIGNELENAFHGGPGRDTLLGRAGDDELLGGEGLASAGSFDERIHGGPGDDTLRSGGGDDRLNGGKGHDLLQSARGRDMLIPGRGDDRVFAGPGNDIVRARNRDVDGIDCGPGWDRLRNDPRDRQPRRRCERHDPIKA